MGSKNRIANEIIPIMKKERGERTWVEPFVGGANIIDKVDGKRIGNDNQKYANLNFQPNALKSKLIYEIFN